MNLQSTPAPSAAAPLTTSELSTATAGIHHVTAIAGDPHRNLAFYGRTLGLRFVKLTINFDDPGTYHFYFGDASASPGSILTFFPWASAPKGRRGTGEVSATAFNVPQHSLAFWRKRLTAAGVTNLQDSDRFGQPVLTFLDPDGMRLELIETDSLEPFAYDPYAFDATPSDIPIESAIRGFHSVTLTLADDAASARLLTGPLAFKSGPRQGNRVRYVATGPTPDATPTGATIIDIVTDPSLPQSTLGAGTVHHLALRATDDAHQQRMSEALTAIGRRPTAQRERIYFRSIYFREPGGVLLEIATDGPGFAADQPASELGTRLMLPPWLQRDQRTLEGILPKLSLPKPRPAAESAAPSSAASSTGAPQ